MTGLHDHRPERAACERCGRAHGHPAHDRDGWASTLVVRFDHATGRNFCQWCWASTRPPGRRRSRR